MSWTDATGRHEGHVKMLFADDKLGGGTYSAAGLSVDGPDGRTILDPDGRPLESRPEAAVIGWRVACNHSSATHPGQASWESPVETWISPITWRRVYSPIEEDIFERRIYAPLVDDGSVFIGDQEDHVWRAIHNEWAAHLEPENHDLAIRNTIAAIANAQQQLTLDVSAARAVGLSWAAIGRAAGMTRQAARDRWGAP
ncbi:hypothetical protein [Rudaeicoccus suwonensis]|uniref:Uncharacterized protein n=1 Tax=Rudaeicoccus suwonensis TaxID=657409 RepID=A0A561E3Y2_9MICO|nr:hypothetical protein [Rudaeicoccus suwonensis]TWE10290.1 hypothetical protein BKA23_2646 [Rudaeicoccus suwonensis]